MGAQGCADPEAPGVNLSTPFCCVAPCADKERVGTSMGMWVKALGHIVAPVNVCQAAVVYAWDCRCCFPCQALVAVGHDLWGMMLW